jgi:UDP-N-acetylglucosamine 2-epimerase
MSLTPAPAATRSLPESDTFRAGLKGVVNPYGDGHSAERIVRVLKETDIDDRLLTKRFADHPVGA